MKRVLRISATGAGAAVVLVVAACSGTDSTSGEELSATGGVGTSASGGAGAVASGGTGLVTTGGGGATVASGGVAPTETGGTGTGGTVSSSSGGAGPSTGGAGPSSGGTATGLGGAAPSGTGGTGALVTGGTGSSGSGGGGPAATGGMDQPGTGGADPGATGGIDTIGTGGAEPEVAGGSDAVGTGGGQDGSGGGSATGGGGGACEPGTIGCPDTTEPPDEPEPTLITSSQNNFWQVGEVTETANGSATFSVDEGTTYQEWIGFGGTFNEAGWDVLTQSVVSAADRELAIKLLFDAHEGANFAWGRIPIGASDYAMDRYSLDDTPDDYAMEHFSIDRDRELLIPYIKAALAVKPNIRLWGSPWSPPSWMKSNETYGEYNGGRIREEAQVLEAYALYLARFAEEYAAEGLAIDNVNPQNEPGYETRYPSCLWTASLLTSFVRDYMGPTFEERGVGAEIWFGTLSAPEDTAHLSAVMGDSAAMRFVKGFGLQWNTIDSVGTAASTHLPVMQTEHKCGNYHWLDGFNPDRPPNDFAYGEESWGLIRDWIKKGVNAYSAWNMVLDTEGKNLDYERPWPQNALLTVDRATGRLTATPAYYVFRHVSQYVEPGAVRVATTGSTDALAFKNPDGSIVTIIYNSGGQAMQTTLGVGGTKLEFQVPARGWATVNWQGTSGSVL